MTVENLVKNKERFDYIFVECSGMADPGSLARIFWVDDELESDVYLDGIITLVDAKHILQHINEVKSDGKILYKKWYLKLLKNHTRNKLITKKRNIKK